MKTSLGKVMLVVSLYTSLITSILASELVQEFSNPSFSGNGYSAHVLSINQLEVQREKTLEDERKSEAAAAERAEKNTTINKFITNVESRIYANLSKQLVDNMFGNDEASYSGSFTLEGNTITYQRTEQCQEDGACIEVIIMTITDSEGSETVITIPIGTGGF